MQGNGTTGGHGEGRAGDGVAGDPPRLGSWARSGGLVGIVVHQAGDRVTLFEPAQRRMADVAVTELEAVPAAAVTITASVDLPLAHGLEEADVRRWVAALLDPVLRERAREALVAAGLDDGAALPEPRLDVQPMSTSGAVCLCGARVPAPPGTALACRACGREAVSAP